MTTVSVAVTTEVQDFGTGFTPPLVAGSSYLVQNVGSETVYIAEAPDADSIAASFILEPRDKLIVQIPAVGGVYISTPRVTSTLVVGSSV